MLTLNQRAVCCNCFLILLAALSLASVASEEGAPSSQAFGVLFEHPIDSSLLASQLAAPPYSVAPAGLAEIDLSLPSRILPTWYLITPPQIPRLLRTPGTRFLVLLNYQLEPLQVLASVDLASGCMKLEAELLDILEKKYGTLAEGKAHTGFELPHIYVAGPLEIRLQCAKGRKKGGSEVLLEYTDVANYRIWHQEYLALVDTYERSVALAYANELTSGERRRLKGIFGISFAQPMPGYEDLPVDTLVPIELKFGKAPFNSLNAVSFSIRRDPNGKPYEIRALARVQGSDQAKHYMQKISAAFREKYGTPMKDRSRHKIFSISSDYLIVKRPAELEIEVAAIYRMGQQQSVRRKRLAAEKAAAEAAEAQRLAEEKARIKEEERQRLWEKETQGL